MTLLRARLRLSLWIALLSLLGAASVSFAEEGAGPWRLAKRLPVDEQAWSWNHASWDQQKITSFGDFQYTVFWDADRVLVLARRDLRDDSIQTLRLPQFTLANSDAHRNTCLGLSPQDGRLHLSWDHHNNPLNYARSRAGFLTNPPKKLSVEQIEPKQAVGDNPSVMSRTTYPRFFNDAKGTLYLFYRQGGSGNGENYLFRYEAKAGEWRIVGKVFSSRGTYGPWENSTSRNAYFHDVLFDGKGRLHVTWVYREAGVTWASNHDLHYAYSDDGGHTWHNNAGKQIADVSRDDPIELADPGIVVREIPVFSWMMNAGCMAIDSKGRPHVMTFKLPSPRRPSELLHDPPPSIRQELRFVHYWRDDDGVWQGGESIEAGTHGASVSRGDIVFDDRDTLYFYYIDRQDRTFRCLQSTAASRWGEWTGYALPASEMTGRDATKHDRTRWAKHGVLSFTYQFGQSGFGIADLTVRRE